MVLQEKNRNYDSPSLSWQPEISSEIARKANVCRRKGIPEAVFFQKQAMPCLYGEH
jgi:hypothetical protein